ncbi:IPP transferase-domain-containing protein [Syncephalastrum racemosum]|uniref:tRNA dimethylallyltransferase n=1 Tax=Syncephalastrum racemosum TaxID=13706 RepID=A0A1X2HJC1_SYNRA|nr:IPP transferase-domain-containing protein [Syncephalastrum racemosum]
MRKKIASIIGTTGVGKSQLAVELCKALHGQVINADAMQVYKGLDIITNKMPIDERQSVKHHLMDFLSPEEEYRVTEFERDAAQCIDSLHKENQFPVVVGGTNYYVQSLLWRNSLVSNEARSPSPEPSSELDALETHELYARLQIVDPTMANKWHPADRRKILRSLQIFYTTGRPQSEIIQEQQKEHEAKGIQTKYKSLIFWLYAEPTKLNQRLDARVDTMIETGLFDEIQSLRKRVVEGQTVAPGEGNEKYQRGLWQAIGYKEFDPYFSALDGENVEEKDLNKLRSECTDRMKTATRRYAKRQVTWIKNKLIPLVNKSDDMHIYLLDATDLSAWDTNVRQKAITIAQAFQSDTPMEDPLSTSETAATMLSNIQASDTQSRILNWRKHECTLCRTKSGDPVILNGDQEWADHLASRFHRRMLKRQRQEEARPDKKIAKQDDALTK